MGTPYYDHANRRAWETEVRTDPETGRPFRALAKEIPYTGEPPTVTSAPNASPEQQSKAQADRLRRDLVSFFAHADDSPLGQQDREAFARQLKWHEDHK